MASFVGVDIVHPDPTVDPRTLRPSLRVSGPDGGLVKHLHQGDILRYLPEGNYTVQAEAVDLGGGLRFLPVRTTQTQLVAGGSAREIIVEYQRATQ